jgi:hypothetical protein
MSREIVLTIGSGCGGGGGRAGSGAIWARGTCGPPYCTRDELKPKMRGKHFSDHKLHVSRLESTCDVNFLPCLLISFGL